MTSARYSKKAEENFAYISEKVQSISVSREKSGLVLTNDEKDSKQQNIMKLLSLGNFCIPTLKIIGNSEE
jgi:hypothetical protein